MGGASLCGSPQRYTMTRGFVGTPEDGSPERPAAGDSSSDRVETNSTLYFRLLILTRRGFLLACMSNLFNSGSGVGNLGKHLIQAQCPDNGVNASWAWTSLFVRAKGTHDSDRQDRALEGSCRAHLDAMFYLQNVSIFAAEKIMSWKSPSSI